MSNIINGAIAVLLMILFLGGLAISIGSIPFSIIAFAVLLMTVIDFVQSVRNPNNDS